MVSGTGSLFEDGKLRVLEGARAGWSRAAPMCDTCTDRDGDGFGDPGFAGNACPDDNCLYISNPNQSDQDGDGFGDACDGREQPAKRPARKTAIEDAASASPPTRRSP